MVVGSIPGLANLTVTNCLLDDTLYRGLVWWCYTSNTLKNQTELSVVSSCILALTPVTTNRLLGASLRGATGSDDRYTETHKILFVDFGNNRAVVEYSNPLRCRLENRRSLVRSTARPIFFPRIDDSHCDRIHSSLTAVSTTVMWESSQWLGDNIVRSTG